MSANLLENQAPTVKAAVAYIHHKISRSDGGISAFSQEFINRYRKANSQGGYTLKPVHYFRRQRINQQGAGTFDLIEPQNSAMKGVSNIDNARLPEGEDIIVVKQRLAFATSATFAAPNAPTEAELDPALQTYSSLTEDMPGDGTENCLVMYQQNDTTINTYQVPELIVPELERGDNGFQHVHPLFHLRGGSDIKVMFQGHKNFKLVDPVNTGNITATHFISFAFLGFTLKPEAN